MARADVNVTIHWFFPNGTVYFVDDWLMPEEEQVVRADDILSSSILRVRPACRRRILMECARESDVMLARRERERL